MRHARTLYFAAHQKVSVVVQDASRVDMTLDHRSSWRKVAGVLTPFAAIALLLFAAFYAPDLAVPGAALLVFVLLIFTRRCWCSGRRRERGDGDEGSAGLLMQ